MYRINFKKYLYFSYFPDTKSVMYVIGERWNDKCHGWWCLEHPLPWTDIVPEPYSIRDGNVDEKGVCVCLFVALISISILSIYPYHPHHAQRIIPVQATNPSNTPFLHICLKHYKDKVKDKDIKSKDG